MKRWIIFQLLLLAAVVCVGQIGKSTFTDSGAASLTSIDEALLLDSGIDYIFTSKDLDSFKSYEEQYVTDVDQASLVVLATPTGNLSQRHFSLGQEIKIDRVIKGNTQLKDTVTAYVFSQDGFVVADELHSGLTYYSIKNLMKPNHQYLVFINPLEINNYLKEPGYSLVSSFFNYLDLTSNASTITNIPLDKLRFSDLKDNEFYSNSQEVLEQLLNIKKQIITKYVGEASLPS